MRLPSFDKRLEPAFREVARALGRLDATQGVVGRRNARQALSKAERKLRRLVDDLYPTIKQKPRPRRRPLSPLERQQKWTEGGWASVPSVPILERITNAGIKTRRFRDENYTRWIGGIVWAPSWAVEIAKRNPKNLRRARRSIRERRAILTELALENHHRAQTW